MNRYRVPDPSTDCSAYTFDPQMLHWEDHPLFHAVQTGNVKIVQRIFDRDNSPGFGRDRSNYIRNECGMTPLMVALAKSPPLAKDILAKLVVLLLEKFRFDPNAADYYGRTALLHAILHGVDVSVITLLLNRGADVKILDHEQLSPLMYAAGLNRADVVRFVCPDYRAQITATLKMKFASFDSGQFERQRAGLLFHDVLEVPFRMEGSPKHYVPFLDSPIAASPINGIKFRLSPSSPAASSTGNSPLSVAAANYPREPNVSRRTSLDKTGSSSKSTATVDFTTYVNVMRRVSSAVFDSRLFNLSEPDTDADTDTGADKDTGKIDKSTGKTDKPGSSADKGTGKTDKPDRVQNKCSGTLQFAQLTQNLCVYLEDVDNLLLDKSPEPRDSLQQRLQQAAVLREEACDVIAERQELEQAPPRRVSLPVSAPILIKSRSVEESIHRDQSSGVGGGMDSVSFRALPRDLRKNALASGHLIERQGSAPQLLLKRKPRSFYAGGGGSNPGSAESSGAASPTSSMSRQTTRLQMMSPLVQSALANYQQK
ncbi:hypothetical protein BV898_02600 [Hypsibius exemplaris]|uniref:Uncharacterized protein n=1 Tax=Hypsibius exemplaris TaxID=2072580 RepID=A0A1W0X7X6_HYPEX|nr:hypothetical protein BV898_02600 [Hypsibius exemplaris]